MPVRSLHSSVLAWPKGPEVHKALAAWAERQARSRPELLRVGFIGSYARGDYGVGSDLDVVLVVRDSAEPALRRSLGWDFSELPVPVDSFVFTRAEWIVLLAEERRFARTVQSEVLWV
jgi:predicted nucleotidyltransferase